MTVTRGINLKYDFTTLSLCKGDCMCEVLSRTPSTNLEPNKFWLYLPGAWPHIFRGFI